MALLAAPSPVASRVLRLASTGMMVGALVGLPTVYSLAANVPAAAPTLETAPAPRIDPAAGTITKADDGMFYAEVRINGMAKRCMIDTGASAMVLDADQAARMGVSAEGAVGRLLTAGGSRPAVRTRVDTVELAGRAFHSVPAIVVRGGASRCLVGQEMLARLDKVEIHADELVMR